MRRGFLLEYLTPGRKVRSPQRSAGFEDLQQPERFLGWIHEDRQRGASGCDWVAWW